MPEFETARQPRAAAQRNRNRLFAAAMELFTGSKDEVTLSAVAERAGVGIGTLYRRFPTRDALVEAVYRNEVERLSDGAPELLRKKPAEEALEEWLTRYSALIAAKCGLSEAFKSIFEPGSDAYAYSRTFPTFWPKRGAKRPKSAPAKRSIVPSSMRPTGALAISGGHRLRSPDRDAGQSYEERIHAQSMLWSISLSALIATVRRRQRGGA